MPMEQSPLSVGGWVDLVHQLADLLSTRSSELGERIARDLGKPIRFSLVEVERTIAMISASVRRFCGQRLDEPAGSARLRRRPLGTVAVITPANNPVYIPLSKIVPAILHGNRVIWKPAPEADGVSRLVIETIAEAGWPADLVECRSGGREEGEKLLEDPCVAAVTITGSESAGEAARQVCSRRNIPLQAELGGNNAAIVWSDANLPMAAQKIAAGAFEMAGQRCTANRRVIVHQDRKEEFLRLLASATSSLVWGDPLASQTQIGPLVSASRRERVAGMVDRASKTSSLIHPLGTGMPEEFGFADCWYPPTIVLSDDSQSEIAQEETFGPVLVVQTAAHWEEAIERCNGVRQGLVAAIFSSSRPLIQRFLDEAEAGILKVNQSTADAAVDVPFCAWKGSGSGPPEHGMFNREFYTRPQTVYEAA